MGFLFLFCGFGLNFVFYGYMKEVAGSRVYCRRADETCIEVFLWRCFSWGYFREGVFVVYCLYLVSRTIELS